MKKVLIITYYWPPSGGPGVQRWLKFTKYLHEFGIEAIVLTVDKDKATYPVTDESLVKDTANIEVHYSDTVEIFSLFKKVNKKDKVPFGGNEIGSANSLKGKIIQFVRGNLFIPDPRRGWNRFALKKATELIQQHNIETVITTSPPHSSQLIGLKLKKKLGVKWIADLRDPWTKIFYYKKFFHTPLAKYIDKRYERTVLKKADHIITVSHALKDEYGSLVKGGINNKAVILPNGYDHEDLENVKPTTPEEFTLTYTGTITREYNFSGLLKALKRIESEGKKVILRFVGHTNEHIQKSILQELPNTQFMGYVPHDKSVEYLLNTTALLLVIPEIENNKGILTGKLFEYLGSQKSIVCLGPTDGDAAAIIDECKAGKTLAYQDDSGIYEFILSLINNPASNSNPHVKTYTRKNLTQKLSELI